MSVNSQMSLISSPCLMLWTNWSCPHGRLKYWPSSRAMSSQAEMLWLPGEAKMASPCPNQHISVIIPKALKRMKLVSSLARILHVSFRFESEFSWHDSRRHEENGSKWQHPHDESHFWWTCTPLRERNLSRICLFPQPASAESSWHPKETAVAERLVFGCCWERNRTKKPEVPWPPSGV
jgi:hypothetical protein